MKDPRILFLTANKLGYKLFIEFVSHMKIPYEKVFIITLSKESKTIMYDPLNMDKLNHFCKINFINKFEISDINKESEMIKDIFPDIIVMAGWRQFISKEILDIPKYFIGFHPSLLPYGRGPAPIINTILEGSDTGGVTLFRVSDKLDSGDVIAWWQFRIGKDDYVQDVYGKIVEASKILLKAWLPHLIREDVKFKPQDESKAIFFVKPDEHQEILPTDPVYWMYRKIRAFSKPYLGAYIKKGNEKLIIWRAEKENV